MSLVYDQSGNPRYFGLYRGLVVDNVDPEKMGRVTIVIPGLVEPASNWAWPFAMGGGSSQNGGWDVPKKGASVGVFFHAGDIDEPNYVNGWYARNEAPSPVAGNSPENAANKIKCFESDDHLVVLDGVKGQVLIKDKKSGLLISMKDGKIELGGEGLVLPKDGLVHGTGTDPFTGMPYWMLGNSSAVVGGKK